MLPTAGLLNNFQLKNDYDKKTNFMYTFHVALGSVILKLSE